MSSCRSWSRAVIAGLLLSSGGCGEKPSAAHAGPEHAHGPGGHAAEEGVMFKEGRGLRLAPEVRQALDVKTADVAAQALTAETTLLAQVFATTPRVLATASVPQGEGPRWETAHYVGARLFRVDRQSAAATDRFELMFEVEPKTAAQNAVGDFITLRAKAEVSGALAIPRSALLDTAQGLFVYVINAEWFLRTRVKTGLQAGDAVEITDGLHAGDIVVATAAEQLWLTELRLTEGGGHSH